MSGTDIIVWQTGSGDKISVPITADDGTPATTNNASLITTLVGLSAQLASGFNTLADGIQQMASKISDEIAAVQASLNDANDKLATIAGVVTSLPDDLTNIQNQITTLKASSLLSPVDQAALDSLSNSASNLAAGMTALSVAASGVKAEADTMAQAPGGPGTAEAGKG